VNRSKGFRLLVGLAALVVLLVAGFSYLRPWVPVWGSTPQERARTLPGDELVPPPLIASWTHGTPNAEAVSLAQMGDAAVSTTTPSSELIAPEKYRNADRIIPNCRTPPGPP
jgi:hypothetical protein